MSLYIYLLKKQNLNQTGRTKMEYFIKKPNLLFLYTDEQAIDTLAAYGNHQIEMPNLNKLSDECTVFEQAYVTQPVCTPSRSSLLTGLYPHANGCIENNIPLKADTPCFPELLNDKEYKTAHFGKWHLGDEIFKQHGFDEWVSIEDSYFPFYSKGHDKNQKSNYHDFLTKNGFRPSRGSWFRRGETARFPEEFSKPAFLANESIRFIENNRDKPFALFVNFLEPHMPFFGPRDDQYDPKDIPLPSNFNHNLNEMNPFKTRFFADKYKESGFNGIDLSSEDGWKRLRANYWGLCSLVDTYIGKIIDKLKECYLYDDTIIVFTSDHGDMMGAHGLLAKCVMFEEAVRVPFFVKLNGQKNGHKVKGPVSQIDIIPTLLDAMNKNIPEHLQGKSLKALVENGGLVPADNDVFIEWTGIEGTVGGYAIPEKFKKTVPDREILYKYLGAETRTIITQENWKYNYSPLGEDELYDLNKDSNELNNLAFELSHQKRIIKLREKINIWREETTDVLRDSK
jgi:arylsulfatase A-like enzyme